MKIKTSKNVIEKALEATNEFYHGNIKISKLQSLNQKGTVWRVRLHTKNSRCAGGAISFHGRRTGSACWHVHGYFFEHIFRLDPNAIIYSGNRKITKDEGNWFDYNVGSIISPLQASDACDCKKNNTITFGISTSTETKTKLVTQNMLSAECWNVQVWGLDYCETCEYKNKRECGGKKIRKTGMNEKGYCIPL